MGQARGEETLSTHVLEALAASIPSLRTKRWRDAALQELTLGVRRHGLPREFVALVRGFRGFEPDAYVINRQRRDLHFFEIEVYNPMARRKLLEYGRLQTDMAYYGIDFGVYVVNRYGHVHRVELLPYYVEWLIEHAPDVA